MIDKLRLTVAPGAVVILDPHPSGFPGLAPLRLQAGDILFAEREEAARLFQDGRVLHPETGKAIERRPSLMEGRPTVQYDGGPMQDLTGMGVVHPSYAALADQAASEPPRARMHYFGQAPMPGSLATIENADGTAGVGF